MQINCLKSRGLDFEFLAPILAFDHVMDALLNMLQSMSLHACWPLTLFGKENIQNVHILDSNFLENKIQMFFVCHHFNFMHNMEMVRLSGSLIHQKTKHDHFLVKVEIILLKEPLWKVHASFPHHSCFIPKVCCDEETLVTVHRKVVAVTSLCADVACLH